MDDDLVERVAKAFAGHPWVAKVLSVAKRYPASVKVELAYRKPVCMVVVPGGLVPVDEGGILLPRGEGDFSPLEATRYPRLEGIDHMPAAPVGSRWTDAKVIGGAEIAAAIGPAWGGLGLRSIVPLAADPTIAGGNLGVSGGNFGQRGGTILCANDQRQDANCLGLRPRGRRDWRASGRGKGRPAPALLR